MIVCYSSNDAYFKHCRKSLTSLFQTNKDATVYIADFGISQSNKDHFPQVNWVKLDQHKYDPATARVGMIDKLEHDRILYLDCDTIVTSNLKQLWEEDLGDNIIGAVQSFNIPTLKEKGGVANYAEFGFNGDEPYFNSGVMIVDRTKWMSNDITNKFIELDTRTPKYLKPTNDEYALNVILSGNWKHLLPTFNSPTFTIRKKPIIYHYLISYRFMNMGE